MHPQPPAKRIYIYIYIYIYLVVIIFVVVEVSVAGRVGDTIIVRMHHRSVIGSQVSRQEDIGCGSNEIYFLN